MFSSCSPCLGVWGDVDSAQNDELQLVAFVNPRAGDNKGAVVMKILERLIGSEHVHDIKSEGGPEMGIAKHCSDENKEVRIIVAGGDGTFSWVASVVEQQNLAHARLMIIPLGSGNDMSRALGWGLKYPGDRRIPRYVEWIRKCPTQTLDVWKLTALEDPSKVKVHEEEKGTGYDARPLMCNYLSLGADAFVELKFNQLRWSNPDKYKSRIGNFLAHIKVGAKYMARPKKRKFFMTDHIETLEVDGKAVAVPDRIQALIILNIPSYGAGTQPWGFTGGSTTSDVIKELQVNDMLVNDGNFEVIGLRGLPHYGTIKLFRCTGVRVAQGQSLKIALKSDVTPFQVDGEPWEQRGGTVTVKKGNPVGVLVGPVWTEKSRKNAKFKDVDVPEDGEAEEGTARGVVIDMEE